jgi:hypothetical protein
MAGVEAEARREIIASVGVPARAPFENREECGTHIVGFSAKAEEGCATRP